MFQFDVVNISVSDAVNAMDESGPSISAPDPDVDTATITLWVGSESSTTV